MTADGRQSFLVLWATPRSTSTAFEWMMRQRGDFTCFHEPWNELYYYGEDRRSQRDAIVPARRGHTYEAVWQELVATAASNDVFVKDFVYSVEHDLDDAKIGAMTHTFLIRDPERVIQGLARYWPDCTFAEVGFSSLHRLFERIADSNGSPPPVIYSGDLVDDPGGTARAYCGAVGIPYIEEALSWKAGDRGEVSWYGEGTGPWHDKLRESSGITRPTTEYPPLAETPKMLDYLERSQPLFDALYAHKIDPVPTGPDQE